MRAAAEEMRRAAEVITTALQQHREWADKWLADFEQIVTSNPR